MRGVEQFPPSFRQGNLRLILRPQPIPIILFSIVAAVNKSVATRDRIMPILRPYSHRRIIREPPRAGTGGPRPSGETRLPLHPTPTVVAVAAAAASPVSSTPPAATSAAAALGPGAVAASGAARPCSWMGRRSSTPRYGRAYRSRDGVHENADLAEKTE